MHHSVPKHIVECCIQKEVAGIIDHFHDLRYFPKNNQGLVSCGNQVFLVDKRQVVGDHSRGKQDDVGNAEAHQHGCRFSVIIVLSWSTRKLSSKKHVPA